MPDQHFSIEFIHRHFPLARAAGVEVIRATPEEVVLEAPLALNHNHLGTNFGGSLCVVASLAGYGMLWLELGDFEAEIVLARCTVNFLRPVRQGIHAICRRPAPEVIERFHAGLAKKGAGKLPLLINIEEEGQVAVEFEGLFVARQQPPDDSVSVP